MNSLFENESDDSQENKKEWYELERVCTVCGAHFMADYKYNNICFSCRFKLENEK